jgi:flavin-dependent thymidylate synthase
MTHHNSKYGHHEEDCTPECEGYMHHHDTPPGGAMQRWADVAMYHAAPDENVVRGEAPEPKVTLVSMTNKPLQVMTSAAMLYEGRVVHNPAEVSKEDAVRWLADMSRTELKAPLEFIDLHFLLEGVTRAFTHQLVRQRTAVYVQESMRFAVKDNAADCVAMPPTIAALPKDAPMRRVWQHAADTMGGAYQMLVDGGTPAEDARSLLPTNTVTKVHYKTNLRGLVQHGGMRLCSQAQYEWKQVWHGMLEAIKSYGNPIDSWQQEAIASMFRPVCYHTGRCQFRAMADRWCVIRERVEAHYAKGEPPSHWTDIELIEPLLEGAARRPPDL